MKTLDAANVEMDASELDMIGAALDQITVHGARYTAAAQKMVDRQSGAHLHGTGTANCYGQCMQFAAAHDDGGVGGASPAALLA